MELCSECSGYTGTSVLCPGPSSIEAAPGRLLHWKREVDISGLEVVEGKTCLIVS